MMKRHLANLAIIVAFVLLVAALPTYAGAADSDFEIKNGVLIRYHGTNGTVNVPSTVTAIGDYAFSKSSFVSNVILPASVKTIGSYAFNECAVLKSVNIGSGVTEIGANAFYSCYYLKDINIPGNVKTIGPGAFANCYSISDLKLGDGLVSLGPRAFSMCIGLTAFNVPANLTSIGNGAFAGCVNLEKYTVSDKNTAFAAFDGVLYSKDGKTLVAYPQAREGAYTLRAGTTTVAGGAFSYATKLTGLAGTQSLEMVGVSAFESCSLLRDIYLPKAQLINDYAFYNCVALKTARVGSANLGKYAFAECAALNTVIISDGAWFINDFAFGWCSMLTNLVLPSSIQLIGNNIFSYSPKNTKVLCEPGSIPHKYFTTVEPPVACAPLPAPSDWAVAPLKAADRFAVANLQIGYKENATRREFALAVANFLEQYYNKGIDALVAERNLKIGAFSDTDDKDILAVNALGIINGTGEGKFSPDSLLTREQAAALMYRVMEMLKIDTSDVPEAQYRDANKISDWAKAAVNVMTELGIMRGDGTNFNPGQQCTREMCIIMFARLWEAVN